MAELQYIWQSLMHRASAHGTKTSALSPLVWLAAISMAGLGTALVASAPPWWLPAFCAALTLVTFAAVFVAFAYFARTNPDALRSEKFMLTKMALEKSQSVKGDHITGLVDVIISEGRQPLTPPVTPPPVQGPGAES